MELSQEAGPAQSLEQSLTPPAAALSIEPAVTDLVAAPAASASATAEPVASAATAPTTDSATSADASVADSAAPPAAGKRAVAARGAPSNEPKRTTKRTIKPVKAFEPEVTPSHHKRSKDEASLDQSKQKRSLKSQGPISEPLWSVRLIELSRVSLEVLLSLALAVRQSGTNAVDWNSVSAQVGLPANECRQLYATLCFSRLPVFSGLDDDYQSKVEGIPWSFFHLVHMFRDPNWHQPLVAVRQGATPPPSAPLKQRTPSPPLPPPPPQQSSPPPQPLPPAAQTVPVSAEMEQNAFSLWATSAMSTYPDEASLITAWLQLSNAVKMEYVTKSQQEQKLKALWAAVTRTA